VDQVSSSYEPYVFTCTTWLCLCTNSCTFTHSLSRVTGLGVRTLQNWHFSFQFCHRFVQFRVILPQVGHTTGIVNNIATVKVVDYMPWSIQLHLHHLVKGCVHVLPHVCSLLELLLLLLLCSQTPNGGGIMK